MQKLPRVQEGKYAANLSPKHRFLLRLSDVQFLLDIQHTGNVGWLNNLCGWIVSFDQGFNLLACRIRGDNMRATLCLRT